MTAGVQGTPVDFPAFWAALQKRYASLLIERLDFEAPLRDVAMYALEGGKRLRPLLAECIGRAVNAPRDALAEAAIAVEYLHIASLLLDDLPCMDDAQERRGRPSAHLRFSESEAILTAVALTSRSYSLLLTAPVPDVQTNRAMALLASDTVAGVMAVGQALELSHSESAVPDRLRTIHEQKTASLFRLTARLVTACAPVQSRTAAGALEHSATLLGRAYQIMDDIEDPLERGGNLARAVGSNDAAREARELLREARATVADVERTDELGACIAWFEAKLDALT